VLEPVPAGQVSAGTDIIRRPELPIAPVATAVTAFVGRTLKGPIDEPVVITSFAQFAQVFGGLWQPSTLSYAIDQYFENGGQQAVIVRVASSGRPPTLDLPTGEEPLVLTGLWPGSREYLRASVDHDGIEPGEESQFNLVVQRVRSPGSELVEQQEIHRRLSVAPGSYRHVSSVLAASQLIRVVGPAPVQRPLITPGDQGRGVIGYVGCNADGDDGGALNDYDVIGNEILGRGLFALDGGPAFNFLCIPPPSRDRELGMSALVVAARFCRRRHALLLVDAPLAWRDIDHALAGLPHWPFHSPDALMFFPRIETHDRLRGRSGVFAACGAAAGLMARADAAGPHWWSTDPADLALRPALHLSCAVSDADREQLAWHGVNTFYPSRSPLRESLPARTLGGGLAKGGELRSLTARRLLLWIAASIERGTRWVLLEGNLRPVRERARAQVTALLEGLSAEGAFAASGLGERSFVICDHRLNGEAQVASGEFHLLYGIAVQRPGDFDTWLVTHRPGGSITRPVSVNRYATSGPEVQVEIETAILRNLSR
jgi:phage tail sheath protein FI